jgi:hypothetical protein
VSRCDDLEVLGQQATKSGPLLVEALKEPLAGGLELGKVLVVPVVENLLAEVLSQPLDQI